MFDSIQQLRQLQQMDDSQQLQAIIGAVEQQITAHLADIRAEIDRREREEWPGRDDLREHLADMDDHQQRDQIEQVLSAVENDVARVFNSYHEIPLVEDGLDHFHNAVVDMIVSLHSPVVQETILLTIAPAYRDRMRSQFGEIGVLFWGWYEVVTGQGGPHTDQYILWLAEYWQMDPDELRELVFGGQ